MTAATLRAELLAVLLRSADRLDTDGILRLTERAAQLRLGLVDGHPAKRSRGNARRTRVSVDVHRPAERIGGAA
jgi:hypothetical protein